MSLLEMFVVRKVRAGKAVQKGLAGRREFSLSPSFFLSVYPTQPLSLTLPWLLLPCLAGCLNKSQEYLMHLAQYSMLTESLALHHATTSLTISFDWLRLPTAWSAPSLVLFQN